MFQGRHVLGLYGYKDRVAEISIARDPTDYGAPYQKQRFWSISNLAQTPQQAIAMTLAHETGHHIHGILREQARTAFDLTRHYPRSNGLSQYAIQNKEEYFAECFAAYSCFRLELLIDDSLGYGMIEQSLKALGLMTKELL